ncbi:MAG: autotransporter outer membrane beta-barrel domain-containing protein, partial [Rhodocyclaceae bacterium]|nr:autotransporter outer membrane beta-barrel domain-containing protein [Rhodocyclaceae bacterium]
GNGSVNGDLVVGGSSALAPGFSPGALTINGNLTLAPNSVLDIQIGGSAAGTQFDYIHVTGSASIAGTLNVSQYNGYVAPAGSQFAFMDFASVSGSFGQVNLPAELGGLNLAYTSGALLLSVPGADVVTPSVLAGANDIVASTILAPLDRLSPLDTDTPVGEIIITTTTSLSRRIDKETPSCVR